MGLLCPRQRPLQKQRLIMVMPQVTDMGYQLEDQGTEKRGQHILTIITITTGHLNQVTMLQNLPTINPAMKHQYMTTAHQ